MEQSLGMECCCQDTSYLKSPKNKTRITGPSCSKPISANSGLNFNLGFLFFVQKYFPGYFSLFFIEHQLITLHAKRIKLNLLFKLSDLNLYLALTLDYLNPALNKPAQNYNLTNVSKRFKFLSHIRFYSTLTS